jgi:hypothetical protein
MAELLVSSTYCLDEELIGVFGLKKRAIVTENKASIHHFET